uniref:COP9 signalosome complex subunit 3 n=1 Tax=Meloidogyne incognita TaxID=6306 RepID=A0A914L5G1_MELIC
MVNIQAFIASVQNLTGDGTCNELVHFCRKWFDENNDKLNFVEADRLLNQLVASQTSTSFTLAIVCCLFCKVTKVKTENELKDFLIGFDEVLPSFDVQQLHWAPDIYTRLLEFTTDLLIKKKVAIWGINLLKTSILIFAQGNSNWLTNIHPLLFCLCLKARYFDNIEPFLKIDVTQLLKQSYSAVSFQTNQQQQQIVTSTDNSNASTTQQQQPPQSSTTTTAPTNSSSLTSTAVSFLQKAVNTVSGTFGNPKNDAPCNKPTLQTIVLFNRRSILLYFYYGALIYGALEKWEDSCLFLEYLITLPSKRCSSIILEGLKKYLIISLIIGRKKPLDLLPSYRTPSLNRNYYHYALVYIRLPHLIEKALEAKKDLVVVLENFLNDKIAVFSKDQNVGLMKVLINVSRENALKRLENIFVSLQLNDVCRLAHMPSNFNNDEGEEEQLQQQTSNYMGVMEQLPVKQLWENLKEEELPKESADGGECSTSLTTGGRGLPVGGSNEYKGFDSTRGSKSWNNV